VVKIGLFKKERDSVKLVIPLISYALTSSGEGKTISLLLNINGQPFVQNISPRSNCCEAATNERGDNIPFVFGDKNEVVIEEFSEGKKVVERVVQKVTIKKTETIQGGN